MLTRKEKQYVKRIVILLTPLSLYTLLTPSTMPIYKIIKICGPSTMQYLPFINTFEKKSIQKIYKKLQDYQII